MSEVIHKVLVLALLALVAASGTGCAVSRSYPAQVGVVLDHETGRPLAGAGILAEYYVSVSTVVGENSQFAGLAETETDADGRFKIDRKTIFHPVVPTPFAPTSRFEKEPILHVFRPGHESLRIRYGKISLAPALGSTMEQDAEGQFVFRLAPCQTDRERWKSLSMAMPALTAGAPWCRENLPLYFGLLEKENERLVQAGQRTLIR